MPFEPYKQQGMILPGVNHRSRQTSICAQAARALKLTQGHVAMPLLPQKRSKRRKPLAWLSRHDPGKPFGNRVTSELFLRICKRVNFVYRCSG